MRNRRAWTTAEYLWRFAVRPLRWLVIAAMFLWAVGVTGWALEAGSGEAVVAVVILYGIWEIGRSIRSVTHMTVNIAKGDKLIVQRGANVSVPKQDLDRVIEAIGRQEASRRE